MTFRTLLLLAAVAGLLAVPAPAGADQTGYVPVGAQPTGEQPAPGAVGIDEKIGVQVNLDLVFRDESERPVTLREAMQGKVTVLLPVYYRCPMLCTKVLNGFLDALRKMPPDFTVGDKFNVVTVSMDPKEHADLGAPKKKAYLDEYGRAGAENGWRFLTGKKEVIGELLETVGYRYEFDKAFKEYNHPSGIILLTPQGKVFRYFYGIGFDETYKLAADPVAGPDGKFEIPTTTLRLSLIEASEGQIKPSLKDRLMLTCYRFDHLSKGYSLHVMRVVQVGGLLTLLLLGTGVGIALRRERRRNAAAAAHEPTGTNGQPGVTA